jgi:hypothetical protein
MHSPHDIVLKHATRIVQHTGNDELLAIWGLMRTQRRFYKIHSVESKLLLVFALVVDLKAPKLGPSPLLMEIIE